MKKIGLVISLVLITTLCGCNGYREIDRGYIVTAMGFGKTNGTTDIFVEALSSSDVSDQKSERVVLKGSGHDEKEAYKSLKTSIVKPLYFEQMGTIVFENTIAPDIEFLKEIAGSNFGIFLVKTDDVKTLFEIDTPNGVLGYDVIALIKTTAKESGERITNQLYRVQSGKTPLPSVNFIDDTLTLKQVTAE